MATQDDLATVPLVEEQASIETRDVVTGKVRIQTRTETVHDMAEAGLSGSEFDIERLPRNVVLDAAPTVRTEGDVTIIPVVEEILVVEKRLVLKEELRISRRSTSETVRVPVELRRQRVTVERETTDNPPDNPED